MASPRAMLPTLRQERASLTPDSRLAIISPQGFRVTGTCVSSVLRDRDCCATLSENALVTYDRIANITSYPEQARVFLEGEVASGVFVLCQGRVKLMSTNHDGKTFIIKIARPGEILGSCAVVTGGVHRLTVETLQRSQLAFIGRADFLLLIQQHADVCLHLAQQLSQDCQSAYEILRWVGLPVREKLARLLLQLAIDGHLNNGMIRLNMALTHEEVAQLIGTTRETVTRTLGELKRRDVLEVEGTKLIIRNMEALNDIAHNHERGAGRRLRRQGIS